MSSSASSAEGQRTICDKLGITPGMVVQEVGADDDIDMALRDAIVERTGTEIVGADYDDVVDVVLIWWREDDGDLVDALVDALTALAASGVIWLLTPKAGRGGHVEPSDIGEAAPTAGLSSTSSISAAQHWSGTRLVSPKVTRAPKR